MKVYTHPTINLPAGAAVVKFYDLAGTGTETTPDIITKIGDVDEGFDINLGDIYYTPCDFEFVNRNNYVLGTLLETDELLVSVVVNNEYYFMGTIDFDTVNPNVIEISATNALGLVSLTAQHIFTRLKNYTLKDIATELDAVSDPAGDYIYLRQFFRIVIQQCGLLYWNTFTDSLIKQLTRRYSNDNGAGLVHFYLDTLLIPRDTFLPKAKPVRENYYHDRISDMFQLLGELAREFFFYPSIVFDGTNFKLKIRDPENTSVSVLQAVKSTKPSKKYLLKTLTTKLDNAPVTFPSAGVYYKETSLFKLGDDVEYLMHYSSMLREDGVTTTAAGTLSSTPIDITVTNSDFEGGPGEALIQATGGPFAFKYSRKDANKFLGCYVDSGTVNFLSGAYIYDSMYLTKIFQENIHLIVYNLAFVTIQQVSALNLAGAYVVYSYPIQAIHNVYKQFYFNNPKWREVTAKGIAANIAGNTKLEYLMPGYRFSLFSENHFIHSLKKSVMRNETTIQAVVI